MFMAILLSTYFILTAASLLLSFFFVCLFLFALMSWGHGGDICLAGQVAPLLKNQHDHGKRLNDTLLTIRNFFPRQLSTVEITIVEPNQHCQCP